MKITSPQWNRLTSNLLIFWFLFLCALHLFSQRPLWNDEQAIFHSVYSFSFKAMFTENLLTHQVFPRVYLFIVQQISYFFHYSLWGIRLASFLCMVMSFYLWIKLARKEFKKQASYFAFLCSWSASMMMIYYAAELKPYSMDVLAGTCGVIALLHMSSQEYVRKRTFLYPLFGFLSYTSFLFSCLILYNFIILSWRKKIKWKQTVIYVVVLFGIGAGAYHFDMQYRNVRSVSYGYHDYFIATDSFRNFFKTFGEGVKDLQSYWFVTEPKWVRNVSLIFFSGGFFYMFFGFLKRFQKDRYVLKSIETIAFALFVALMTLGLFQKYPFIVARTVLFFGPIAFYLNLKGIEALGVLHHNIYDAVIGIYISFMIFLSLWFPRLIISGERIFQPIF